MSARRRRLLTPRTGAGARVARRCGRLMAAAIAILIVDPRLRARPGPAARRLAFLSRRAARQRASGRRDADPRRDAGGDAASGVAAAAPLGVGTAIYLVEYTREGRLTRIIRFGAECLAGVPSIIFGLFGFVLFVLTLGFGWSILAGAADAGVHDACRRIIRTSEEALRAVPAELSRGLALARRRASGRRSARSSCPPPLPGS